MLNKQSMEISMCSSLHEPYLYYLDYQIENRLFYTITNHSNEEILIEEGTLFQCKAKFGDSSDCLTQEVNKSKISFHFQSGETVMCSNKEDYIEASLPQDILIAPEQSYQIQLWGVYSLAIDTPTTIVFATLIEGRVYKLESTLARKRKKYILDQFQAGPAPMYRGSISFQWHSEGVSRLYLNTRDVTGKNYESMTLMKKETVVLKSYDECDNVLQCTCIVEPVSMEIERFEISMPYFERILKDCLWSVKNSPWVKLDYQNVRPCGSKQLLRIVPSSKDVLLVFSVEGYPKHYHIFIHKICDTFIVDTKFIFTTNTFSWDIMDMKVHFRIRVNQEWVGLQGTMAIDEDIKIIYFMIFGDNQFVNGLVIHINRTPVK